MSAPWPVSAEAAADELTHIAERLTAIADASRCASTAQGDNPLSATETRRYAATLRRLLTSLGREIVDTALINEGEADLLDAERQEVDRLREFLNSRVFVPFQLDGGRGRGLALLDAFSDELLASEHDSSPSGSGQVLGTPDSPIRTVGLPADGAPPSPGAPSAPTGSAS